MNTSNNIERLIDRALRREPDAGPPADFARSVAARAEQASATDARLERWLLRGLGVVFACATLAACLVYGREWIAGFALLSPAVAGATALNWMLAGLGCIALSWSFERLRLRSRHPPR